MAASLSLSLLLLPLPLLYLLLSFLSVVFINLKKCACHSVCVAQKLLLAFLLRRCLAKRFARRGQGRRQLCEGPGTMHGCWPHKLSIFFSFACFFSLVLLCLHFFETLAGLMLLRLAVLLSNR